MFVVMAFITKAFEVVVIKCELGKVSKILFVMDNVARLVLSFGSAAFTLEVLGRAFAISKLAPRPGVIERRSVAAADQFSDPFGGYFSIRHNKKRQ